MDGQRKVRVELHIHGYGEDGGDILLNCGEKQSKRVWEIKNELMERTHVAAQEQILVLPNGTLLSDPFDDVEGALQLNPASVFLYRRIVVGQRKEIHVRIFVGDEEAPFIRSNWPNEYTVFDDIWTDSTVLDLKQCIDARHGVPPGRQILHARFPPLSVPLLDDNCRLGNTLPMFGFCNSDTVFKVRLTEIPRDENASVEVNVKIVSYIDSSVPRRNAEMTNRWYNFKMDLGVDTVYTLRAEIGRKDEIDFYERYLGYSLRTAQAGDLDDGDLTLSQCGIQANHIIFATFDTDLLVLEHDPEYYNDDDFEEDGRLYF